MPSVLEYVYLVIRTEFSNDPKIFSPLTILCYYGETDDVFLVGGLVSACETPIAAVLRHCRQLIGFELARNYPMFLCNVIEGFKDHESIKIYVYCTDVFSEGLRFRHSHDASRLADSIHRFLRTAAIEAQEEHPSPLPEPLPPATIGCTQLPDIEVSIYDWEDRTFKTTCFDYAVQYTMYNIDKNLGVDAGIVPLFENRDPMRDCVDENGIWAATDKILRSRLPASELDMNRHLLKSSGSLESANMSRFLQKLEHCTGDDSNMLHDHLKHAKLKIQGFGINPNSKKVVVVLVSSSTGKLGNWASDHSPEIYEMNTLDELADYVRDSFTIEDIKGKIYILS